MEKDKTLVLGASENPSRYSNMAILRLNTFNKPVVAIGRREGMVDGVPIKKELEQRDDIDTVTLYLNPTNQKPYYDYILSLKPRRIIFNPGTENIELQRLAATRGIMVQEACTLVMLGSGRY